MLSIDQISRIQIELTTRCNARCPMCMRNYRGSDYNSGYPDCELSADDIRLILPAAVIQQLQQNTFSALTINFNGNLGDFASARDAAEIVEYLADQQVIININTNGSLRNAAWWSRLARPGVTVGFAIDGLANTHALYRQDTDWHKIIQNAQAFITAGGAAVWRFVPFDHNRHQETECRTMAQDMGFVQFENIYDGRDRTSVYARSGEFSHHIGAPYDGPTPAVSDMLTSHVTWYNSTTVQVPADVEPLKLNCTHKMNREIYIAADGSVYPCCYLGFYPATMTHPGNEQLKLLVHENNALVHGLEHCLNWFDRVENTWQEKSVADGRLYACVSNCGKV